MTLFRKKIYNIPRGRVLTYMNVARYSGRSFAARAVGNALNKNYNLKIPCHRVVCSDSVAEGFNGGSARKVELLKYEGIQVINKIINLKKFLWKPTKKIF